MTKNLKIWVFALMIIFTACSKDSDTDSDQDDQAIEELENTPLLANEVADNVVVRGGTKNDGTPPTPNEAISLDVSASSKTALLGEGFEVSFNSDGNVTGAYLQFKANDGAVADSYYDIDINANTSIAKSLERFIGKNHKKVSSIAAKVDDDVLDVDFNSNIEPGTFCYVICVYDSEGNISAPEEVCVTVESWGGNSNLVAAWELTKEEDTYQGETEIYEVGTPDCYEQTLPCEQNQEEVNVSICYTQEYGRIELKSDGTFVVDFKSLEEDLDYDASSTQCMEVIEEDVYRFQANGYWAFVSDEKRLTLVGYSFTTEEDGEIVEEVLNEGEGELIFDGIAEVNGNIFTIAESYDNDGDGTVDELYTYYFEK